MPHKYRIKAAWISYLGIQVFWLLCIFATPVLVGLHPSKFWAVPLCGVTAANGLHLIIFRREYNALLRKAAGLFPYARYLTPAQMAPKYFLPFGVAYTMFGLVPILLLFYSP
jgi:hypothetical protein